MLVMLLLVGLFIGGLAYWKATSIQKQMAMHATMGPPPTAVTTVKVQPQTWQPILSAIGSLRAVNGVTVSTDLAGIVSEIAFESGTLVKKGDLLVKLDTQQEDAQLRSAEARLALAKSEVVRKGDLVQKKAIAASEWDSAESELRQAEAAVEEMRALVARKRISAPFDGMIGIRQVNIGQYLQPGADIVPLVSMDPVYVDFSLPQQHLSKVAVGGKVRISASGSGEQVEGDITAVDSRVDESTRNIMVQATIQNPEHKLRPGMFVDVQVLLPETENILAIPSSAISYAPYGDSVFVVTPTTGPDGKAGAKVVSKFVKLGTKRGDQVSVVSGLQPGDEVVSSGVFKLRPDAPVHVNNEIQPGNELNPRPSNS